MIGTKQCWLWRWGRASTHLCRKPYSSWDYPASTDFEWEYLLVWSSRIVCSAFEGKRPSFSTEDPNHALESIDISDLRLYSEFLPKIKQKYFLVINYQVCCLKASKQSLFLNWTTTKIANINRLDTPSLITITSVFIQNLYNCTLDPITIIITYKMNFMNMNSMKMPITKFMWDLYNQARLIMKLILDQVVLKVLDDNTKGKIRWLKMNAFNAIQQWWRFSTRSE